MGIESVETFSDRTVIQVSEPTRFGEPDGQRKVVIWHDFAHRELPRMSLEWFRNPLDDPRGSGREEMQSVEVEPIGTVVFVLNMDCDWSSATYRAGAHTVSGPYLLEENDEPAGARR